MHKHYLVKVQNGNIVIERRNKQKKGKTIFIDREVIENDIKYALSNSEQIIKEILFTRAIASLSNATLRLHYTPEAEELIKEILKNR